MVVFYVQIALCTLTYGFLDRLHNQARWILYVSRMCGQINTNVYSTDPNDSNWEIQNNILLGDDLRKLTKGHMINFFLTDFTIIWFHNCQKNCTKYLGCEYYKYIATFLGKKMGHTQSCQSYMFSGLNIKSLVRELARTKENAFLMLIDASGLF